MSHFVLTVKHQFSATRALRDYEGPCQHVHEHHYGITTNIATPDLPQGYALDFYEVQAYLAAIVKDYEKSYLNELPPFIELNPTTENIAKWIFEQLAHQLADKNFLLQSVTVQENDLFSATYFPQAFPTHV